MVPWQGRAFVAEEAEIGCTNTDAAPALIGDLQRFTVPRLLIC